MIYNDPREGHENAEDQCIWFIGSFSPSLTNLLQGSLQGSGNTQINPEINTHICMQYNATIIQSMPKNILSTPSFSKYVLL